MQNQLQDDPTELTNSTYRKPSQKELAVLRLIHRKNDVSRVELIELTGFSAGLITGITQALIGKQLVTESPGRPSAAGRKPLALRVRPNAAYVVGVDLGSFYLRVVVTDILGNLVHKLRTETSLSQGREKVLDKTFTAVHKAINECGIPKEAIGGIGMAHSGIIDSATGVVLSYPRPGQMTEWKNVPLQKMLEQEFAVPCVLEDSVRAIALAERCFGIGTNLEDFVYIDVGMGIGAGIFLNGNLYKGFGGGAGEFGHMTVEENGPLCCCGNNGCLEMMASCAAHYAASSRKPLHRLNRLNLLRKSVHGMTNCWQPPDVPSVWSGAMSAILYCLCAYPWETTSNCVASTPKPVGSFGISKDCMWTPI